MSRCISCSTRERAAIRKLKAVAYKGGECRSCGYKKCKDALEFHHRNALEKSFKIGGSHCLSWDRIKSELDKCDLVCANCHREIAAKLRLDPVGLELTTLAL